MQNFENLRSSVAGEILILSNQLNNIPLNQAQTYLSQPSLPRFQIIILCYKTKFKSSRNDAKISFPILLLFQVSLNSHPTVASVWVTMSPGAFQKFAIFVVEILDGNNAINLLTVSKLRQLPFNIYSFFCNRAGKAIQCS